MVVISMSLVEEEGKFSKGGGGKGVIIKGGSMERKRGPSNIKNSLKRPG